jgi:hypothetical protein
MARIVFASSFFARLMKQAVWIAALIMLNAHALPPSDAGCTESDGEWTCQGDLVEVNGSLPPPPIDSFGCRKNPQNCLPPTRPPRPGVSTPSTGGSHASPDVKDAEVLNQALLRSMNCGQLSAMEEEYEAYVETDKTLLEMHQTNLKEIDATLQSEAYSDKEMDYLLDLKTASCGTYENTREQRLNAECTERQTNNKPTVCRPPAPSRSEVQQAQKCLDNTRELTARAGDLAAWKNRKIAAEARIESMKANLKYDSEQLRKIRAEKKLKKCAP